MKRKLGKIGSIALATLCLSLCACGGATDDNNVNIRPQPTVITNETYQSYWMKQHDYKTMPIAAFNGMGLKEYNAQYADMVTEEHYAEMAACYINTSYALYDNIIYTNQVVKVLEYAEKYNISYLAIGTGFDSATDVNKLETQIYKALIKNKPKALGGILIKDEPSRSHFEQIATSRATFEKLLGKNFLYHSNVFPDYATEQQRYGSGDIPEGGYSHEQYVDDYIRIYKPQILSFAYYPLFEAGIMQLGYFDNMSVMRRKAAEAKIPFWFYVQTCSFSDNTRIPSEADLHWLVNTALAYGSKGIQYFTYVVPISFPGGEQFNGAMIDLQGNPTEVYGYAQTINKFITEVDEVLMCSLSKGLMKSGTSACGDIPARDLLNSYGALSSVAGDSVLVGCFDYNGKDAYYVVNNSVTDACTATLNFKKAVNGYVHNYSGKTDISKQKSLNIELGAGEAALVVLD